MEYDDLYKRIIDINKVVCISTQSVVYHFGSIKVEDNNYNKFNNSNRLYYEKKWKSKYNVNYNRQLNLKNLKIIEEYKFYDNNSIFFKDIIKGFINFYKKLLLNIYSNWKK